MDCFLIKEEFSNLIKVKIERNAKTVLVRGKGTACKRNQTTENGN